MRTPRHHFFLIHNLLKRGTAQEEIICITCYFKQILSTHELIATGRGSYKMFTVCTVCTELIFCSYDLILHLYICKWIYVRFNLLEQIVYILW